MYLASVLGVVVLALVVASPVVRSLVALVYFLVRPSSPLSLRSLVWPRITKEPDQVLVVEARVKRGSRGEPRGPFVLADCPSEPQREGPGYHFLVQPKLQAGGPFLRTWKLRRRVQARWLLGVPHTKDDPWGPVRRLLRSAAAVVLFYLLPAAVAVVVATYAFSPRFYDGARPPSGPEGARLVLVESAFQAAHGGLAAAPGVAGPSGSSANKPEVGEAVYFRAGRGLACGLGAGCSSGPGGGGAGGAVGGAPLALATGLFLDWAARELKEASRASDCEKAAGLCTRALERFEVFLKRVSKLAAAATGAERESSGGFPFRASSCLGVGQSRRQGCMRAVGELGRALGSGLYEDGSLLRRLEVVFSVRPRPSFGRLVERTRKLCGEEVSAWEVLTCLGVAGQSTGWPGEVGAAADKLLALLSYVLRDPRWRLNFKATDEGRRWAAGNAKVVAFVDKPTDARCFNDFVPEAVVPPWFFTFYSLPEASAPPPAGGAAPASSYGEGPAAVALGDFGSPEQANKFAGRLFRCACRHPDLLSQCVRRWEDGQSCGDLVSGALKKAAALTPGDRSRVDASKALVEKVESFYYLPSASGGQASSSPFCSRLEALTAAVPGSGGQGAEGEVYLPAEQHFQTFRKFLELVVQAASSGGKLLSAKSKWCGSGCVPCVDVESAPGTVGPSLDDSASPRVRAAFRALSGRSAHSTGFGVEVKNRMAKATKCNENEARRKGISGTLGGHKLCPWSECKLGVLQTLSAAVKKEGFASSDYSTARKRLFENLHRFGVGGKENEFSAWVSELSSSWFGGACPGPAGTRGERCARYYSLVNESLKGWCR